NFGENIAAFHPRGMSNGAATHAVAPRPDDCSDGTRDIGGPVRQRAGTQSQCHTAMAVADYTGYGSQYGKRLPQGHHAGSAGTSTGAADVRQPRSEDLDQPRRSGTPLPRPEQLQRG